MFYNIVQTFLKIRSSWDPPKVKKKTKIPKPLHFQPWNLSKLKILSVTLKNCRFLKSYRKAFEIIFSGPLQSLPWNIINSKVSRVGVATQLHLVLSVWCCTNYGTSDWRAVKRIKLKCMWVILITTAASTYRALTMCQALLST